MQFSRTIAKLMAQPLHQGNGPTQLVLTNRHPPLGVQDKGHCRQHTLGLSQQDALPLS